MSLSLLKLDGREVHLVDPLPAPADCLAGGHSSQRCIGSLRALAAQAPYETRVGVCVHVARVECVGLLVKSPVVVKYSKQGCLK